MSKCHQLMDSATLFMKPNQSHDDVNKHGQAALEVLYNSKPGNSLDFERAARFSSKVASRSIYLPLESLPPTCDAAKYHSYRVYRPGLAIVLIQPSRDGCSTKANMWRISSQ